MRIQVLKVCVAVFALLSAPLLAQAADPVYTCQWEEALKPSLLAITLEGSTAVGTAVYRSTPEYTCDTTRLKIQGLFPPFQLAVIEAPYGNLSQQVVRHSTTFTAVDEHGKGQVEVDWTPEQFGDLPAGDSFALRVTDAKEHVKYLELGDPYGSCWHQLLLYLHPVMRVLLYCFAGIGLLVVVCFSVAVVSDAIRQRHDPTATEDSKIESEILMREAR
ncbi:hypothetical protein JCM8097_000419 [Rhodosporidiobolus ruineniae]